MNCSTRCSTPHGSLPAHRTARTHAAKTLLGALACAAVLGGAPARGQLKVPQHYPTIQTAIDAAPTGATITVAPGSYEEQIVVAGKSLRLVGLPGATIVAPAHLEQTLLPLSFRRVVLGMLHGDLEISGFAFDGGRVGDQNQYLTGIHLVAGGGWVHDCSFTGFRSAALLPSDDSVAVLNWNPLSEGVGIVDVAVTTCVFADNFVSIALKGDDDNPNVTLARVFAAYNTITGLGPTPLVNQFGIRVLYGATGVVLGNTVTDHTYLGTDTFAVGILLGVAQPGQPLVLPRILCADNVVQRCNSGIAALFCEEALISGNAVSGGPFGFNGIAVSGENNSLVANDIDMSSSILPVNSGVGLLGLEFGGPLGYGIATGTKVLANLITGAEVPVLQQTGVTGTVLRGNRIRP